MISLTICLILLVMVLFGVMSQGSGDYNDQWSRVSWIGIGCGLLIAQASPNPFAAILIALAAMGLIWRPPMHVTYQQKLAEGLVLAGAYVVAAPRMELWMVVPLLGMMGVVGALIGLWAWYSSCQGHEDVGYKHEYLGGWLIVCDRSAMAPLAGQGNFNHAGSVGALSAASSAGLVLAGYGWAWPCYIFSIIGVVLCTEGRMTGKWMSQGPVHLAWLGTVILTQAIGGRAWALLGLLILGLTCYAHPWCPRPSWHDSGRFAVWNMALRQIWWKANQPLEPLKTLAHARMERGQMEAVQAKAAQEGNAPVHNQMTVAKAQNEEVQRRCLVLAAEQAHATLRETWERDLSWRLWAQRVRVRLLGHGTGSWYPLTKWPTIFSTGTQDPVTKQVSGMVYLSAHNEYVEVLFEQGVLGLVAALGLAGYALATTWGTPVFLPVMVLLSVCMTNFPFTLFAEVERSSPAQPEQFVGAPAMLVMAWTILLLVEAVR